MNACESLRIAVIATDGVEESELLEPVAALSERGFPVDILSTHDGDLQSFAHHDKGSKIPVDKLVESVNPDDYAGLLLPGGALNADALRVDAATRNFVREFDIGKKPIAFICHAPWVLISARLVEGRTLTGFPTIEDDVRNAGGHWVDHEVCMDYNWVSSRKPADMPAFIRGMIATFLEFSPQSVEAASSVGL